MAKTILGETKRVESKLEFHILKKKKTITTNIFIVTSRLSFILLIRHDRLFSVFDICLSLGGICIKNGFRLILIQSLIRSTFSGLA
jgi:hypothetical protein